MSEISVSVLCCFQEEDEFGLVSLFRIEEEEKPRKQKVSARKTAAFLASKAPKSRLVAIDVSLNSLCILDFCFVKRKGDFSPTLVMWWIHQDPRRCLK